MGTARDKWVSLARPHRRRTWTLTTLLSLVGEVISGEFGHSLCHLKGGTALAKFLLPSPPLQNLYIYLLQCHAGISSGEDGLQQILSHIPGYLPMSTLPSFPSYHDLEQWEQVHWFKYLCSLLCGLSITGSTGG